MKLYTTLIIPGVVYASETWTMTSIDTQAIRIFEWRILRKMYGPIKEGDEYKTRTINKELEELFDAGDIVKVIKAHRVRWLVRMREERMTKNIFRGTIDGRRRRERPRKRWRQNVKENLRNIDILFCRQKVNNNVRRRVARETKARISARR